MLGRFHWPFFVPIRLIVEMAGGVAGSGGFAEGPESSRCSCCLFSGPSAVLLTPPPRRSVLAEFNDPDDLILQRTFQKAEGEIKGGREIKGVRRL